MNPQTDAPPSHPHRRFGAVDSDDLARLIENPPQPTAAVVVEAGERPSPLLWFAVGALASGAAFLMAAWVF